MRTRRMLLAGTAALLSMGAAPRRTMAPNPAEEFPIPPIPPTEPPPFQAAPVPDATLSAPRPATPTRAGPQLRPDFFNQRTYNGGQGYLPGSSVEVQQEQRLKPVPGLNLKMPFQ